MARMGSIIDTERCKFLYEYSPNSYMDTVGQSFIGRACGFKNKNKHKAVVYSRVIVAQAYDMLMKSGGKDNELIEFTNFCKLHKLMPASRASLDDRIPEYHVKIADELRLDSVPPFKEIGNIVNSLKKKFNLEKKRGSTRWMSHTTVTERKRGRTILNPSNPDNNYFCGIHPGDWSIIIYDRFKSGSVIRKSWKGFIIKVAIRTDKKTNNRREIVGPKTTSFHPVFRKKAQ